MSVIIRLQGLPWTASALDIRNFFQGLQIPPGGVHIIGGEKGDAFIAFVTDEDARQAMMKTYQSLNGSPVQLLLSSKTEMQNVIEAARTGQAPEQLSEPVPRPLPVEPLKPYDDPLYRGPPGQELREGYLEDYSKYGGPDANQGMLGNEQQGFRDDYGNRPPDPWAQVDAQNRYPDEGFPPENRIPYGNRDGPRDVPPRIPFDRDGPPRDGPPFDMRNRGMPNDRFQDPFLQNTPEQQQGTYNRPPVGDSSFDRNQGPMFGMHDPSGPTDRRPPHDLRRQDNRGEMRRGPEGRFSDGREGRDGRDRDGRDRDGRDNRDGRDWRDRRDRSDRDRSDRDRPDRDRFSRLDRSERSDRPDRDRSERPDRSDRSDRSRRDQDRERRDISEPRRDSREPRESREARERPPDDRPFDQRNSPMSRSSREHPGRNSSEPRGLPGRAGPDSYGQHDGNFDGRMPDLSNRPDQFQPGDHRRRPDEVQGPFPSRERGLERPKSRFDQEMVPGRFGPDGGRMPAAVEKDPDFRPDLRGPPDGPRGRGRPPMFPDQGNGFDSDGRQPDLDFRGGQPSEPGFPSRPQHGPPQGRGRAMEGLHQGMRPPGFHDEGYPRGPGDYSKYPSEDGYNMNAPWEMDSSFPPERGPGGPSRRPPPRQDFMDKRQGPGNGSTGQKGLLGDAPGMFIGGQGPMDRPDLSMDHDGREPNRRPFPPERPGSGQFRENFSRPGEPREFSRGDEYEGRQRFRGRDMDQRSSRDERGPRPLMPEHDRRRPDWGSDGGPDGGWPDDMSRGRPRRLVGREMHDGNEGIDQLGYSSRDKSQGEELNRKRPRQPETGNVFVHIKNLPYSVSYSMVRRFFTGCDIPYDGLKLINNDQGKRNGTAYIRFMSEEACFNAIKRNGMEMNGRTIIVHRCNEAEFERAVDSFVPEEDEDEPEPAKRPRSDEPSSKETPLSIPPAGEPFIIKLNNLPLNVTVEDIKKLFSGVKIAESGEAVYMEYDSGGSFSGVACVEVESLDDYKTGMGFEGRHMGSRILRVTMGSKSDMTKVKSSQPKGDLKTQDKQQTPKLDSQSDKNISDGEKGQGDEDYPYICIHLTGLSPTATFRELRDFVSGLEVAPRGIQICHDGVGNPVGEGFIEFTSKKDCKEASKRDQNLIGSNTITVKPILKSEMILRLRNARNINTRSGGPPPGIHGPGGLMSNPGPQMNIKPIPPGVLKRQWVYLRCSNLPLQVTIRELLGFFNQYNPVPESIRLHYTGDGNPTGNAVVGFPTKEEASKAMADLNGTLCRRNNVVIQPANS